MTIVLLGLILLGGAFATVVITGLLVDMEKCVMSKMTEIQDQLNAANQKIDRANVAVANVKADVRRLLDLLTPDENGLLTKDQVAQVLNELGEMNARLEGTAGEAEAAAALTEDPPPATEETNNSGNENL